jgi:hypothetical protein
MFTIFDGQSYIFESARRLAKQYLCYADWTLKYISNTQHFAFSRHCRSERERGTSVTAKNRMQTGGLELEKVSNGRIIYHFRACGHNVSRAQAFSRK